jgi:hypothetical protein
MATMDLKEIMSVSGQSGLFRFVSQGRNGIIVESFLDKKRSFISASHKVSSLADIAIFTDGEEVPLLEVLKKIHESGPDVPAPDSKSSPDVLKKFMEKILPNYDRERVYVSDIKKLASWYNTLLELKLLNFEEEIVPETDVKPEEAAQAENKPEKKAKPSTTAKTKKTVAAKKTTAVKSSSDSGNR